MRGLCLFVVCITKNWRPEDTESSRDCTCIVYYGYCSVKQSTLVSAKNKHTYISSAQWMYAIYCTKVQGCEPQGWGEYTSCKKLDKLNIPKNTETPTKRALDNIYSQMRCRNITSENGAQKCHETLMDSKLPKAWLSAETRKLNGNSYLAYYVVIQSRKTNGWGGRINKLVIYNKLVVTSFPVKV